MAETKKAPASLPIETWASMGLESAQRSLQRAGLETEPELLSQEQNNYFVK